MDIALELANLSKTYKVGFRRTPRTAVVDVSLSIPTGKVFGLLGPNGAGKTTTIKMAVGFLRPDSGSVRIFGMDAKDPKVRAGLGFLPEHPYFYPHLTAEKALDFYAQLFRIRRSARREKTEKLLDLVGLTDSKTLQLGKFSKGMLQRLGIAQALVNDPELLIVDEPASGLDPIGQVEMRNLLTKLNAEGKSILLSSHYLSDVENLCHEVAFINKGTVIARGTIESLLDAGDVYTVTAVKLPKGWRPVETPATMERLNGSVRLTLTKKHVDEAIGDIHSSGGKVEDVRRMTKSLEELFMELVGGEASGD
ncbi:MAG: ABC transporter ATP-binding protein [Candidatus Aquicultorales bacterium]